MNARKTGMILMALATGLAFGIASAKLPAPTEEQKAKAAEAKAKADDAAKRAGEMLAKSQDRAVENYRQRGKVTKTAAAVSRKR